MIHICCRIIIHFLVPFRHLQSPLIPFSFSIFDFLTWVVSISSWSELSHCVSSVFLLTFVPKYSLHVSHFYCQKGKLRLFWFSLFPIPSCPCWFNPNENKSPFSCKIRVWYKPHEIIFISTFSKIKTGLFSFPISSLPNWPWELSPNPCNFPSPFKIIKIYKFIF